MPSFILKLKNTDDTLNKNIFVGKDKSENPYFTEFHLCYRFNSYDKVRSYMQDYSLVNKCIIKQIVYIDS